MDLQKALQEYFGYSEFRGVQKSVIETVLNHENSLVVMPTGMGKSICFQLPSAMIEGMTVVISPLIALMKDQVDKAPKKLNATFINSSLSSQQKKQAYEKLKNQKIKLLYVTPERFRSDEFKEALSCNKVSLLAVDEAHCISEWGHDFRPDYTKLKEIREFVGNPTTIALTATATPDVQEDILVQLGLNDENCEKFIYGFRRENLSLNVLDLYGLDQKVQASMMLLNQNNGPCIIYFSLIDTLKKFSRELDKLGIEHTQYHGQLKDHHRKMNQNDFIKGDVDLILATPAFGLGVDKPDVRQVIHAEVPNSIEAYYQEVGRAGRDGKPAHCTLLFDEDDISIQMDFIKWANPDPGFIKAVYNLVQDHHERIKVEGVDYLREKMNFYNRRDFRVETALNLLERWGCIFRLQHKPNEITVLKEPPEEFLNTDVHKRKLENQNKRLLNLVQLIQSEGEEMKENIYKYFGVTEN